jgi:tRNA dimethylallyltransferase
MIHGPTASGKTKLAIEWAKSLGCEILNCDARQIYKELKIGVARPSTQELGKIHHFGIASHSIHNPVSAVSYSKWAKPLIRTSLIKNGNIVIVGGSGLYAKALLYKLDILPNENKELREKLEKKWNEEPNQLVEYLKKMDPEYAKECDMKNSRRVIRAIEVIESSGEKYSDLRTQKFRFQILMPIFMNMLFGLIFKNWNQGYY